MLTGALQCWSRKQSEPFLSRAQTGNHAHKRPRGAKYWKGRLSRDAGVSTPPTPTPPPFPPPVMWVHAKHPEATANAASEAHLAGVGVGLDGGGVLQAGAVDDAGHQQAHHGHPEEAGGHQPGHRVVVQAVPLRLRREHVFET